MQKATIGVPGRFLLKSEVDMKVRLAKKIIKKQCRYWEDRRVDYEWSLLLDIRSKKDHLVRKANIVTKWRYAKIGGRHEKKIL